MVAPGRELASQIASVLEKLLEGTGIRSSMAIGGANPMRQVEKIRRTKPQVRLERAEGSFEGPEARERCDKACRGVRA